MRKDMAKVVTERPRHGHSNPSKKTRKRLSKDEIEKDDHGSTRSPISRRRQFGWNAKEFSDLLGPLRRYLHSKIGQPWDEVYSEISKTLDKRTVSGLHILDHVKYEVEQDVMFVRGIPHAGKVRWQSQHPIVGFYVDPNTGLLQHVAKESKKQRKARYKQPVEEIKVDDHTYLRLRKGIWYQDTVSTKVEDHLVWDLKLKDYCLKKVVVPITTTKQLSSKELKQRNLRNQR